MSFENYNRTFSAEEQAKMASIKNHIVNGGSKEEYDYPDPVEGQYIATIDKMFLREEKGRLVFRVTMQLLEGADENTEEFLASWPGKGNPKVPFARPVTGTKNDAVCLGSVVGLLNRFAETDEIEFDGDYGKLAQTIDNVFATVKDMGGCSKNQGAAPSPHQDGGNGNVLRVGILCRLWRKAIPLSDYLCRTTSWTHEQECYTCATYRTQKKCSAHYIRAVVLEQLVLQNLQRVVAYAQEDEDEFVRRVMENKMAIQRTEQEQAKRKLDKQERRISELDAIIQRLYEDRVTGTLSAERFAKLSEGYEKEQVELRQSVEELQSIVAAVETQSVNIKSFLKIVKKYTERL